MPELPDLAVIGKNLDKRFAGKKLAAFNVFNHQTLNAPAGEYKSGFENQTLESVARSGK